MVRAITERGLLLACIGGDVATVQRLLEAGGADVHERYDQTGFTALHFAAQGGHVEVMKLLLQTNADPSATTEDGHTPLHLASREGNVDAMELLLKAGASTNVFDKHGLTPLHIASDSDEDHATAVELLLNADMDPNVADPNGATALYFASRCDHLKVVELLLKHNADPNLATQDGETPLHIACEKRKTRVVRALLEAGALPRTQDNEGREPFHRCLLRQPYAGINISTLQTLQVLISFGATWDATCDELQATGKAWVETPALHVCVTAWTHDYMDGIPFTPVEFENIARGPDATRAYIQAYKNSNEIKFRRKVCIVGPSKAGKTSLVKSLTTQHPSLEHPDERTMGIDHFQLRFGVREGDKTIIHEITFWDFAGQDAYQVAHSLFYSKRTLYLVCVDLEALIVAVMQSDLMGNTSKQREQLMNEFIERDVLRWVRGIFSRQPDAEFVFIATKDDLLVDYPAFTREVKALLAAKLAQVEGIVMEMKRENVEDVAEGERRADTLTLHAYQKRLSLRARTTASASTGGSAVARNADGSVGSEPTTNLLTQFALRCQGYWQFLADVGAGPTNQVEATCGVTKCTSPDDGVVADATHEPLFVSCTEWKSVMKAREDITTLIVGSDRSYRMPESYTQVLDAVVAMRELAGTSSGDTRVKKTFAPVDALVALLLAKISKEANGDVPDCRSILQTLHDLGDVLWYEDLGIPLFEKLVILDPLLLIDFVRQVITHQSTSETIAHVELLGLPFWNNIHEEDLFLAMKQVLQTFQLVHPSDGAMRWNSDLIVPAFWKRKTPASWLFGYEDVRLAAAVRTHDPDGPVEQLRVHWEYHFAHEFPDALFDHLVVATYSPMMKRTAGPDWILYTEDYKFACRVMVGRAVAIVQRVLHLEAVLASETDDLETEELWEAFDCLSLAIVKVLRRYPGLVVTSVALDDDGKIHDLESLFSRSLSVRSRKWMPPIESWKKFKQAVQRIAVEEDEWVLLP